MGQIFCIFPRPGPMGLTPPPPLTVNLSVKYPGGFDYFPKREPVKNYLEDLFHFGSPKSHWQGCAEGN